MSAKSKHQLTEQAIQIKIDETVSINGDLSIIEGAKGIVLFAHGSGSDPVVIDINRQAAEHVHAEKKVEIIPGATHLFEEPGTLEQVAHLAAEWFAQHVTD
jgi:alpha-beta hydrolase superfamily lysophospholipase